MMGKDTKRLSYKSSYKNFLLQHICFFILRVAGIGEYCFVVIFPSVYVISKSIPARPQMIFALVIPLGFIIFAIIACVDAGRYGEEIRLGRFFHQGRKQNLNIFLTLTFT